MFWVANISGKLETIIIIAELWERPASWLVFKSLRIHGFPVIYCCAVCSRKDDGFMQIRLHDLMLSIGDHLQHDYSDVDI